MATSKQNIKHLNSSNNEGLYRGLDFQNNHINARKIDSTKMLLELQKGEFSPKEAWFVKDEENNEYVVVPESVLKGIILTIKKAYEDKLKVEIERDIIIHTPIDFDDVKAVANTKLEKYRKSDGTLPKIDTRSFVNQIKKEYPNLFFNIDEYFRKQKSNGDS
ncbi:DUF2603 domain-containing protein [Helicobacter cappadocius]|uniref:UPF0763 protein Q5I04_00345 n=1 Tax=Helicobacter cappadocius TaxID=3063998 RepID=A0AA90T8W8_9HELI|nr:MULTISPECIES: DUF2603 domain-containing protein [unclassified Helicobacter]MDO7252370.1 DUF2603 domain-containing protein [Helicobacter sp. faydin-H75]MDP2538237.1 DUF2603 domain-containing protein [Helicobacter sp. faydin-H76]